MNDSQKINLGLILICFGFSVLCIQVSDIQNIHIDITGNGRVLFLAFMICTAMGISSFMQMVKEEFI